MWLRSLRLYQKRKSTCLQEKFWRVTVWAESKKPKVSLQIRLLKMEQFLLLCSSSTLLVISEYFYMLFEHSLKKTEIWHLTSVITLLSKLLCALVDVQDQFHRDPLIHIKKHALLPSMAHVLSLREQFCLSKTSPHRFTKIVSSVLKLKKLVNFPDFSAECRGRKYSTGPLNTKSWSLIWWRFR